MPRVLLSSQVWQARFGAHIPPPLVAAFTAALADPKPMHRTAPHRTAPHRTDSGRSLPTLDPDVVTRKTTDVLAALVAGALKDRVRSLAARHTATPAAPVPSRQAPPRHHRSR
ncbi:DUF317 domain-containing protein [Streptomyces sp. NRRL S-1521]|uniref:DUF317 domain-containing protein n=1 Tax=Streptomyces sp. NRRL S-1521 TaxID=1609100 RepID=UPI0007464C4F|nr:DUF317 domain-containing protein [Streptomyces sp. NRRL S-1521]KUL53169.1 hypothetical protein ADL30_20705 [Streptomyces sp. NRRL S-1521]